MNYKGFDIRIHQRALGPRWAGYWMAPSGREYQLTSFFESPDLCELVLDDILEVEYIEPSFMRRVMDKYPTDYEEFRLWTIMQGLGENEI